MKKVRSLLYGYYLPIYINHHYEFTDGVKMKAALNRPFDIPVDNMEEPVLQQTNLFPA